MNRVELTWEQDLRFDVLGGLQASIVLDGTHVEQNPALNPMEALLASLGGCTAMDVISILRKKRQRVTRYRIEVEGDRANEHPRVFTAIRIRHLFQGHDLSESALRQSIELSEQKYCPIHAMLSEAVPITSTFELQPVPAD